MAHTHNRQGSCVQTRPEVGGWQQSVQYASRSSPRVAMRPVTAFFYYELHPCTRHSHTVRDTAIESLKLYAISVNLEWAADAFRAPAHHQYSRRMRRCKGARTRCWPAAALGIKGNSHRDWDTRIMRLRTGFLARSMPRPYATELDPPLRVQQPQKRTIRLNC